MRQLGRSGRGLGLLPVVGLSAAMIVLVLVHGSPAAATATATAATAAAVTPAAVPAPAAEATAESAADPRLGPNLVANGSFETDANRDGKPDRWVIQWMWAKTPNRAELATGVAADGQRSLHVVVTETGVAEGWGGRAYQDIRVTPGTTYHVSASIKMKDWQSLSAVEGVGITGLWRFTDGSWSEQQTPITEELFSGNFDWKRFEAQITAPDGADCLRLAAWANTGTGEIWFDDIRVQAQTQPPQVQPSPTSQVAAAGPTSPQQPATASPASPQQPAAASPASSQQPGWSLKLDPRPVEARAVWIDEYTLASLTGRQSVVQLMDALEQAGINMVFPFVWMGGYALWRSEVATVNPAVDAWGEDPLQVLIEEAHRRGIEVHPVAVVFMVGSKTDPGPIALAHPDWVQLDRNGNSVSPYDLIWVSPALPEVQDYVMAVLRELVSKYNIDGLQLDYIRYEIATPTPFGYNARELARYQQETGVDARQLVPGSEGDFAFAHWRAGLVTSFVQRANRELKAINPRLLLSAAVDPDYRGALALRYQDWKYWVDQGYLDLVFPMAYSTDVKEVQNWVKTDLYLAGLGGGKALVYAGIGSYLLLTPDKIVEQVELVRGLGAPGNSLFCTLQLDSGDYGGLAEGPYRYPALPPHRAPGAAAAATVRVLAEQVKAAEGSPEQLAQDLDRLATRIETLARAANPPSAATISSVRANLAKVVDDLKPAGRLGILVAPQTATQLYTELNVADQLLAYWSFHPKASG